MDTKNGLWQRKYSMHDLQNTFKSYSYAKPNNSLLQLLSEIMLLVFMVITMMRHITQLKDHSPKKIVHSQ